MLSSPVIGLKDAFSNTSDPAHFLEFHTRARSLQVLSEPVQPAHNIRMLVGEPGMGKTALVLRLLQQLQPTVLGTRLFWTQLRRSEFLHCFLHELGIPRPSPNLAEAQKQLTGALEQNFSRGREVMVVIDEAHDLKISTLRGVAELLDCPAGRSAQLRIILAGLPVLKVTTASAPLAEFSQRISGISSLEPLTFEESCSYIRQKLDLCGLRGHQRFTEDAIILIATLTGIPRDINNLCFEAAYRAEQQGHKRIDEELVLEVTAEAGSPDPRTHKREFSSNEAMVPLQDSNPDTAEFAWRGRGQQFEQQPESRHGSQTLSPSVAVCSGSIDELPACISDWFGDERLAWAGTTGELASSLQQPEAELMELLTSSSDALRDVGIQLDLVESYGHSSSVQLRALESRRKRKAETVAEVLLETREQELPVDGESAAPLVQDDAARSEVSQQEITDRINDVVETDAVPVSAFEKTLEKLLSSQSESIRGPRRSRLRHAVVPVLLSVVALGLAVAIEYEVVNGGGLSVRNRPTATQPSVGEHGGTVAGNDVSPRPSPDPSVQVLKAAKAGDANAQLELGTAYATGRGVPEDPVAAYTWLTVAFANGNKRAEGRISELTRKVDSAEIGRIRWNLGEMYADGIGVRKDNVTAYMWYLLAELSGETRSRVAREQLGRSMPADQKSEAKARASDWLRKHQQAAKIASLPPDLK